MKFAVFKPAILPTFRSCILPVSVGHHTAAKVIPLLADISRNAPSIDCCHIIVTLQRHNNKNTFAQTKSAGDAWICTATPAILSSSIPTIRVTRWSDWLESPLFPEQFQRVVAKFATCPDFNRACWSQILSHPQNPVNSSQKYVLEAVLSLWNSIKSDCLVYPGTIGDAIRAAANGGPVLIEAVKK
jgi:hypothetical protein